MNVVEKEATSAEASATKAPHQLELTNGAIYLLEGCLQDLSACNTPDKIIKWGKCWKYIRAQNDRKLTLDGSDIAEDFEKIVPPAEETQAQQQDRVTKINEAHAEWAKQPRVLALSDKRRDICRDAVKWWAGHKDKKPMSMSDNLILLFEAFGVGDSDEGTEE